MARRITRSVRRRKIQVRIRNKIQGTAECPRLCVFRSLRHMSGQLVDDVGSRTLLTVSTLKLEGKKLEKGGNLAAARRVGRSLGQGAKELGVNQVVFDRSGYVYQGRVRALAQGAREAGLQF